MTRNSFRKISFILTAVVLSGTLYLSTTYATLAPLTPPPFGGYDSGTNSILDPGCIPTDTDCFVKTGLRIGEEVIDGTATQILYTDNSGNLFSDSNFTRDSVTQATAIGTPIAAAYGEPNSQFYIVADTTGNTGNTITITFDGVVDVDTAVTNWNSANPSNTAHVVSGGTYVPSAGSITLAGGGLSQLGTGSLFGGAIQGSGMQTQDTTNNIVSAIATGNLAGFGTGSLGNVVLTQDINSGYISALLQGTQLQNFIVGDLSSFSYFSQIRQDSTTTALLFSDTSNISSLVLDTNGLNYITNGITYYLPNGSLPNIGDVMTVISTSGGNTAYLGFSPAGGGSGWALLGNSGTTAGTNFIGTTDTEDFVIKVNNNEMGRFYEDTGTSTNSIALGGGTASSSNMFVYGNGAGSGATNASYSNFFGNSAGFNATNAYQSNFFGHQAGQDATNAFYSIFIGARAGFEASEASTATFIGNEAGYQATNAIDSTFIGQQAGYQATNASNSTFIGRNAGYQSTWAAQSNFFGNYAGQNATYAAWSNFFGLQAGDGATNASNSNFFGQLAGEGATDAIGSNFIGWSAGRGATNASNSNFIGTGAGDTATNADYSNFIGVAAGSLATNAQDSTFIGQYAGAQATNATGSVFLGSFAGHISPDAAHSIFIGFGAGDSDNVDNTTDPDDYSILIGNDTDTGGFSNSIALGSYATNDASNQFMVGSMVNPINSMVIVGNYAGGGCSFTINGMSCSSDERLKTNINDLDINTLDILQNVRTVTYNWNDDSTGSQQIGFIAQDIQQYFPQLVNMGQGGYLQVNYAGMTPVLVEAIQEMNLNITDINNTETPNTWRDALIGWFGNVGNGIQRIFTKTVRVQNGVEMVDRATGQLYCTYIENGELQKNLGECTDSISVTPPPSVPTISPDPVSDPVIDPMSNPDITPDPVITPPETPTVSDPVPPSPEPEPVIPTE